jgi:hypothetical protein
VFDGVPGSAINYISLNINGLYLDEFAPFVSGIMSVLVRKIEAGRLALPEIMTGTGLT